jgi:hypothetical protein
LLKPIANTCMIAMVRVQRLMRLLQVLRAYEQAYAGADGDGTLRVFDPGLARYAERRYGPMVKSYLVPVTVGFVNDTLRRASMFSVQRPSSAQTFAKVLNAYVTEDHAPAARELYVAYMTSRADGAASNAAYISDAGWDTITAAVNVLQH